MYSVTIGNAEGTKVHNKKFETNELKSDFVRSEFSYTLPQLKALWAALTKSERDIAKNNLWNARIEHMKWFDKNSVEVEKELA